MSLLHDLIQEMDAAAPAASTGASAIAATPGSLFAGGVIDSKKEKRKKTKMMRRIMNMKESLGVDLGGVDFDASDIISRIDAAVKKTEQNDDTTAFGLEDEDGNMVKVYVRDEQAKDFEHQLATMLAGEDDDANQETTSLEIAEVLFKLKDKFDIVDVEWPGIEGDEEEEQEMAGAEGGLGAEAGAEGGLDAEAGAETGDLSGVEGDEAGLDAEGDMTADEEGAESALKQVIDMMKSDAEAKKAEADARTAEAKAKEAEFTAQSSANKVRKEEQIYDMEAAEKEKSEQDKETQQLAKLARFQHQKAQDAEVKLSMEGKEESKNDDGQPWKMNDDEDEDDELTLKELSTLIMRNLGHN